MAHYLRDRLQERGWRIVNDTRLPLVCFTRDDVDAQAVADRRMREQIAWMSTTVLRGERVLRCCITHYETDQADVDRLVEGLS